MDQEKVLEIFVQLRKVYNLLGEVQDISRQMAESLDRDDQTAFHMQLAMRREPIQEMAGTKERIMELLREFPREDAHKIRAVLNGGPGTSELESRMAEQVASNNRMWEQVYALDRRLNEKVTHDQSVYSDR